MSSPEDNMAVDNGDNVDNGAGDDEKSTKNVSEGNHVEAAVAAMSAPTADSIPDYNVKNEETGNDASKRVDESSHQQSAEDDENEQVEDAAATITDNFAPAITSDVGNNDNQSNDNSEEIVDISTSPKIDTISTEEAQNHDKEAQLTDAQIADNENDKEAGNDQQKSVSKENATESQRNGNNDSEKNVKSVEKSGNKEVEKDKTHQKIKMEAKDDSDSDDSSDDSDGSSDGSDGSSTSSGSSSSTSSSSDSDDSSTKRKKQSTKKIANILKSSHLNNHNQDAIIEGMPKALLNGSGNKKVDGDNLDDLSMTSPVDDEEDNEEEQDEEVDDLMEEDEEETGEQKSQSSRPTLSSPQTPFSTKKKRPKTPQKAKLQLNPLETEFAWLYAESTFLQIHKTGSGRFLDWTYITSNASPMLQHIIKTKNWNDGMTRVSAFYVRGCVASMFDEKWKEILKLLREGYRRELTTEKLPAVSNEMKMKFIASHDINKNDDDDDEDDTDDDDGDNSNFEKPPAKHRELTHEEKLANLKRKEGIKNVVMHEPQIKNEDDFESENDASSLLIPVVPWQSPSARAADDFAATPSSPKLPKAEESHYENANSPGSGSSVSGVLGNLPPPAEALNSPSLKPTNTPLNTQEEEFAWLHAESTFLQKYKTGSGFFVDWDYIENNATSDLKDTLERIRNPDKVYRVVSRFIRKSVNDYYERRREDILKMLYNGHRREETKDLLPSASDMNRNSAKDVVLSLSTANTLNGIEEELAWLLEESKLNSEAKSCDWNYVLEHASDEMKQLIEKKKDSSAPYDSVNAYVRAGSIGAFCQRRVEVRKALENGDGRPTLEEMRSPSKKPVISSTGGVGSIMLNNESATPTTSSFYPILPPPPLPPNSSSNVLNELEEEFSWLYEESMMKNGSRTVDWDFIEHHATPKLKSVIEKRKAWKNPRLIHAYIRSSVMDYFHEKRKEIQAVLASGYRRNPMKDVLPTHSINSRSLHRHHLTDVEEEFAWLYEESMLKSRSKSCSWSFLESYASPNLRDFIEKKKKSWKNYKVINAFIRQSVAQHFMRRREEIRDLLKKGFRRDETKHVLPDHDKRLDSSAISEKNVAFLPSLNEIEEEFSWLYEESMFFLGMSRCDWGFIEKYASPNFVSFMENRKKTWKSHRFVSAFVRPKVMNTFRVRREEMKKMLMDGKMREECTNKIIPDLKKEGLYDEKNFKLNDIEEELAWLTVESCIISQSSVTDWDFIECYASSSLEQKMEGKKKSGCNYRVLDNYIRNDNPNIHRLFHMRRLDILKLIQEGEIREKTKDSLPETIPQSIEGFLSVEDNEEPLESFSGPAADFGAEETNYELPLSNNLDPNFKGHASLDTNISAPKELSNSEEELAWLMEESILSTGKNIADWGFIETHASADFKVMFNRKKKTCNGKYRRTNTFVRMQNPMVKAVFKDRRRAIRTLLSRGYRRNETKHALPKAAFEPIEATQKVHARGDKVYAYFLGDGAERNKWLPGSILGYKRCYRNSGEGTLSYSVQFDGGFIDTRLDECFVITEDEHVEKISQNHSNSELSSVDDQSHYDPRKETRLGTEQDVSMLLSKMQEERDKFAKELIDHRRKQESRASSMRNIEKQIHELIPQFL